MKAETLADYRFRIADRTLITLSVVSIERILDERLRLLVALHAARRFLEVDDCYSAATDTRKVVDAALEYADEPIA